MRNLKPNVERSTLLVPQSPSKSCQTCPPPLAPAASKKESSTSFGMSRSSISIIEAEHGVIVEEQQGVKVFVMIVGVVAGSGVDAVEESGSSTVALIGEVAVFVEVQSRMMFK